MASSFDRMKVTPQVTYDTTVKAKNAANFFLRMPAHYSKQNQGAVGSNPIPYVSPYFAMKARGSRRVCYTSPDFRTSETCEEKPY